MKLMRYVLILILLCPTLVQATTKAVVDITKMSITELSNALDKGYLTSELLVTLYLERIEAYDDKFNAINQINENALEEAKALDKERNEGNVRSILHGIPIVVKTNIDVEGLATTAGAKALEDNYPIEDAEAIKKLKEAGAIILANTNMSEFAFSAGNSNSSYGRVGNAFNPSYSPYGSSGGSAVAVATSFAAASLGTDTNSSVRMPAAAAGLVGLRPTLGLISSDGVIPYDITRDTIGILSKTVRDNAIILSIINEEDKHYEPKLDSLEGLTIGVINSYLKGDSSGIRVNNKTDSDIYNLAQEKINLLEEAGANIVYLDEFMTSYYYNLANQTMGGGSFCDGFNEYIKGTTGSIRSFNALANASGRIYSLNGYLSECNGNWQRNLTEKNAKKEIFENHVLEVFEEYDLDLIIYPTTKNKVFTLKVGSGINGPGSFLGSVIGYPSITVPMGYIDEFSYGLEFFSLKKEEQLLYQVAQVFENKNNLELTNSSLTPSLYEVPEYLISLKEYYEQEENKLTNEVKEYFLNYSRNTDEKNEEEALNLIKKYELLEEQEKLETETKKNNKNSILMIMIIFLSLATLVFIMIIGLLLKRIKQFYQKTRK